MKHGIAFRKFSRTSSHRMLMLRNLVTSLFEHERIKTTLPKARDTARLAEKIITLGKNGDAGSQSRASAFLLKPATLDKLLATFATRYADRPGGYTRIHKLGNRKGDNAPQAVLELVDNPEDLRWEMTARAVGWDIMQYKLERQRLGSLVRDGAQNTLQILKKEKETEFGVLRPKTRWNVQKLLRYRGADAIESLSQQATEHADKLLATPLALKTLYERKKKQDERNTPPRPNAGQKHVGETRSVLDVSRGRLGHVRPQSSRILTLQKAFNQKYQHP